MCSLSEYLQQCRRSLCVHPVSELYIYISDSRFGNVLMIRLGETLVDFSDYAGIHIYIHTYIYIYIYIYNNKYIYIWSKYTLVVWFGGVLWHILCYLIPNPVYTYILNIYMICKHILSITLLNESELFFLHTVKWFQELLYNSHNFA